MPSKKTSPVHEKPSFAVSADSRSKLFFAWLWSVTLKLSLALVLGLVIYFIYLDGKVKNTFEGARWQVPVQVYGKVFTLQNQQKINVKRLIKTLNLSGYKKVVQVKQAGEYSLNSQNNHQKITIYRRAFDFGLGAEKATKLSIVISNNQISQLFADDFSVKQVQLEPILLDRIVPSNKEDRILVSLEQVPEKIIDTLLLVEDRNFYYHVGIAPLGILRALMANISAGRTVQGGSTLTQQLVKNMFLTRSRTLSRKINEAFMALIIEHRYSKDQLLEAYINEVYLGQNAAKGIYGFGLASKFYFGKKLEQLSNAQIALLIAQIKGPSYYDPWRHAERARNRRDLVLRLMFEQHFINRIEFEQALDASLSIRAQRRMHKKVYPAYMQLVKQELKQHLKNLVAEFKVPSGLRVFTGFDIRSQHLLEQTVQQQLPLLEKKHQVSRLEVAMLVTDIESGEIQALVGGREVNYAGFNRALKAKRPIGSLVKPAVYLAALERYQDYNLATPLQDKPIKINNNSNHLWQPKNYDGKYRGQVSLLYALVHSLNVPTVNLGLSLGLDKVAQSLSLLGYDHPLVLRPSLLLGSINLSPVEVNQLYMAIAGQGFYQKQHVISAIYTGDDELLWQAPTTKEQRISSNGNYLLNYALRKVAKQGTARSLSWRLPHHPLAGKTGTTNKLRDSWFVGYDAKHLVTTWVGRDDNKPSKLTGSSGALVLFANFMKKLGVIDKPLVMPDNMAMILFEQKTGNAVTAKCSDVVEYPAVKVGVVIKDKCAKVRDKLLDKKTNKNKKRSWLERLFGG
ncbi:MAG: penicillin-binding protein 1B [Alteromonadaceae bacterium]|nr:penicillin-binding protein 1B [Alteromonadaceae bacterium]